MKPAAIVGIIFFSVIALLHLLRLIFGVAIIIGATEVPMWASVFAVIGPGALAAWLWHEQRPRGG